MDSIPKPIVDALIAAGVALIAALVGVAIAALNALRKRLEQDRNVQAAEVAVAAAEQLGTKAEHGPLSGVAKKALAQAAAPGASSDMIEAAVWALKQR